MLRSLKLENPQCTHIIVGVTATVPEDGILKGISTATWTLQHPPVNVLPLASRTLVEPKNLTVVEYLLMPVDMLDLSVYHPGAMSKKDFKLVENISERLLEINVEIDKLKIPSKLLLKVDNDLITAATQFCTEFSDQIHSFCVEQVRQIQSDNWVYKTVVLLMQNARVGIRVKNAIRSLSTLKTKYNYLMNLMSGFEEREVENVLSDEDFERLRITQERLCCLLLFTDNVNQKLCNHFFQFKLKCESDYTFCVVDLNRVSPNCSYGPKPKFSVIRVFENGECVTEDVMRKIQESRKNVAVFNGKRNKEKSPQKRATLEVPCPGHYTCACPPTNRRWTCQTCMSTLYYGYDDQLYCICGSGFLNQFEFQCVDEDHDALLPIGPAWKKQLESLVPLKEVNILILGQSGVGKSTWINSTSNYMFYPTLDEAVKSLHDSELLVPIPTRFTITDDNMEPREVRIGDDEDEDLTVGASSTKNCKTYSILFQNYVVNFINTPGLGNCVDENRKNLKKVLDYIRYVPLIHGICILLKSNEAHCSALMSYGIKELLSNLHQSCTNNLMFCFTNTRSTFYKPGKAMLFFMNLLKDMGVTLSMPEQTFCLDNEGFQYLCCKFFRGITFTEYEQESYRMSWDKSVAETERLLKTVLELEPHPTQETVTLNRVQNVMLSITQSAVDITQNIEKNIEIIRTRKLAVEVSRASATKLRKMILVPQLDLLVTQIDSPRLVCTAEKCIKYITLQQTNQRVPQYVQHCPPHCSCFQNAMSEVYPNRDILRCPAVGGTLSCQLCGCLLEAHMHIYYEQTVQETIAHNPTAQQRLNAQQSAAEIKRNVLAILEERLQEFKDEKKTIVAICVKFFYFLRANAIAPCKDVIGDYIDTLIKREEQKGNKSRSEVEMLKKLQEEKRILEIAEQQGKCNVTAELLKGLENQLYNLPITGSLFRQIMKIPVNLKDQGSLEKAKPKKG